MLTTRPRITIQKSTTDLVLDILVLAGMVGLWLMAAFQYGGLPERIPSHFDGSGAINGYSDKSAVFLLPIIATAVTGIVFYIRQNPQWHNYPVKVTAENALSLYTTSIRSLSWISFLCVLLFLLVEASILYGAHYKTTPEYFKLIWVIVAALFIIPIFTIIRFLRKK